MKGFCTSCLEHADPGVMQVVKGIVEGCRQSDCVLLGGEVSPKSSVGLRKPGCMMPALHVSALQIGASFPLCPPCAGA